METFCLYKDSERRGRFRERERERERGKELVEREG